MNLLVINGPNLNMLGIREPDIYGRGTYADLIEYINEVAATYDISVQCFQSNHEGEIIDVIQGAFEKYDGIIINAGGYSHTSVAILDALKAVNIPTVEVHLSDPALREEFRHRSYISLASRVTYKGLGFEGYKKAIEYFVHLTNY